MIPNILGKQFNNVVSSKQSRRYETKEEKIERLSNKIGIQKHGKGKRKNKKGRKK